MSRRSGNKRLNATFDKKRNYKNSQISLFSSPLINNINKEATREFERKSLQSVSTF